MTSESAPATPPDRDWVAYVGPFQFPWGQPGSRRVYGVARAILATGRDVVVLSGAATPSKSEVLATDDCGSRMSYVGMNELGNDSAGALTKAARVLLRFGSRTTSWLAQQSTLPSHVIVYGGSPAYVVHLGQWCRRNGVPLIIDVVEWYDPTHVPGGRFGPFSLSSMLGHRFFHRRANGVIAISSYLEKYYQSRNSQILRLPPTVELEPRSATGSPTDDDGPLRLIYFGTPGRKDSLETIISAVALRGSAEPPVKLVIVGPTENELNRYLAGKPLPENVLALGKVDQERVREIVSSADFSLIVRPNNRSSMAGFPTKFVESLAVGTPVMANATSDLCEYLTDGENGILVESDSVSSVLDAIHRATQLGPQRRSDMRAAAYESAHRFDWTESVNGVDRLLNATTGEGR